ncbi:hypothetical protein AXF42_Ash016360 [Apostasia shenzhenica]|uniref:Protein PLASTID REDOX INSENSITIVE 2, chloroplastic n=1 Tax=Apostasia shenzhenica TaxID=1088818 RepID=A0A2H9ZZY7_9ASPA|nr:hypothetical protein AXF42_Ash016360 [Apostasia shenzhenica]
MALLIFSSALAASSRISATAVHWGPALAFPAKAFPFPLSVHSQAPSFPSLGESVCVGETSKSSTRAAWQPPQYVYPDPSPEFARFETQKFEEELLKRLLKNKETFGDDIEEVVRVCAEIFSNFLHKEYGGPGTLLVEPFTDMLLELKEKKLPGAPVAARAALLWAQNFVDRDWEIWTSQPST